MKTRFTYHSIYTKWIFICGSFALLGAISSCGGEKDLASGPKNGIVYEPAPQWISQRPQNPSNYIGIGSAYKASQPLDYAGVAKKNALNDLATEISVRVQGNTFLNTLEINKNFSEEFMSTISTTTNEEIEDFEIAGIWENEKEYWIYYRLNKAQYQEQKRAKKRAALSAANDYYLKGLDAENVANIPAAVDLFMRGLLEMQKYWDEANAFTDPSGKEIYLDNEIYTSIQRVCGGMFLEFISDNIILSRENQYSSTFPTRILYKGMPVKGVSVMYSYDKGRFSKPKELVSDENGKINVPVSDIDPSVKLNSLELRINPENFAGNDLDKKITAPLLKNTKTERRVIPIEIVLPSFYLQSDEKNFGNPSAHTTLSQTIKKNLTSKGMRFVDLAETSDYIISVSSNTTQGGTAQGFHVAYLEMSIAVKDRMNGQTIYGESLNNIKGLQLNFDAAGIDAYKKGAEKIDTTVAKALIDAIL
ncbi:MAG: LPP20 family lipoprotein [Flavobacteriales bacterium]|nr:LPP20 family lipoprotein [Flavobacteriales bacterium]